MPAPVGMRASSASSPTRLEQCWHDAPGGTAVAALEIARRAGAARRGRRSSASPGGTAVAARGRVAAADPGARQLPLGRGPWLYEAWLRARAGRAVERRDRLRSTCAPRRRRSSLAVRALPVVRGPAGVDARVAVHDHGVHTRSATRLARAPGARAPAQSGRGLRAWPASRRPPAPRARRSASTRRAPDGVDVGRSARVDARRAHEPPAARRSLGVARRRWQRSRVLLVAARSRRVRDEPAPAGQLAGPTTAYVAGCAAGPTRPTSPATSASSASCRRRPAGAVRRRRRVRLPERARRASASRWLEAMAQGTPGRHERRHVDRGGRRRGGGARRPVRRRRHRRPASTTRLRGDAAELAVAGRRRARPRCRWRRTTRRRRRWRRYARGRRDG